MNNRYREEEKYEGEVSSEEVKEDTISNNETVKESKKNKKENKVIDDLNDKISKLEEENKNWQEKYYRTLADSENFKKRIDDERIRERKYGSQKLIEKLLNDLDIFDKAVNMKTDDPVLSNFLLGFAMINGNLQRVLNEEGVKKIKAVGEMFDPRFHNAVETEWDEEKEEGICLKEMLSGYMYKDRVLRASNVVVNKKPEEIKEESKTE